MQYQRVLESTLAGLDFLETPWIYTLNPSCAAQNPPDKMLAEITEFYSTVNSKRGSLNEDEAGAVDYMKVQFFKELCELEMTTCLDEDAITKYIMDIIEPEEASCACCPLRCGYHSCVDSKLHTKILNVISAFENAAKHTELTVDFIKAINKKVGEGLFEGGLYRSKDVAPLGYASSYIPYKLVSSRLDTLVAFWTEHFQSSASLESVIKLSAVFFAEFLRIHPFVNGNGRTVRLLLQWLLKDFCFTPFSVYAPCVVPEGSGTQSCRSTYLKVLNNAQLYGSKDYDVLATYLLFACFHSSKYVRYLL